MSFHPADGLEILLGGAGASERVEAREARQTAKAFDRLPRQGVDRNRTALETLGFVIGDNLDELFVAVTPPDGWTLQPSETDSRHSTLYDDAGCIRGSMFYKAAFYDRDAYFSLYVRFAVEPVYKLARTVERYFEGPQRYAVFDRLTKQHVYTNRRWLHRPVYPTLQMSEKKKIYVDIDGKEIDPNRPLKYEDYYGEHRYRNGRFYTRDYREARMVPVPSAEDERVFAAARTEHMVLQKAFYAEQDKQQQRATTWLKTHYPNSTLDPLLYWNKSETVA